MSHPKDFFPSAYIEDGPELRRALRTMGLEKPRLFAPTIRVLVALLVAGLLSAALWVAFWFAIVELAKWAPL